MGAGGAALSPGPTLEQRLEREAVARVAHGERLARLEESVRDFRAETEMRDGEHEQRLRTVEKTVDESAKKLDHVETKVDALDNKMDQVLVAIGAQGSAMAATSTMAAQALVRASQPDRDEVNDDRARRFVVDALERSRPLTPTAPEAEPTRSNEEDSGADLLPSVLIEPAALTKGSGKKHVSGKGMSLAAILTALLTMVLAKIFERYLP